MAIMWMTYDVDELETEVYFFIHHDVDAVLSFRVALNPIAVDYHIYTERQDFIDGCLMVITVTYTITIEVWVSLTRT